MTESWRGWPQAQVVVATTSAVTLRSNSNSNSNSSSNSRRGRDRGRRRGRGRQATRPEQEHGQETGKNCQPMEQHNVTWSECGSGCSKKGKQRKNLLTFATVRVRRRRVVGGKGIAKKKDGEALVCATLLASSLLFAPKHQTGNKLVYFSWQNYAKMRLPFFCSSVSLSSSSSSSLSFFLVLQLLLLLLQVCAQFLFAC